VDPNHTIHLHGDYQRYANCDDNQTEDIPRFLCLPCGHTISVLPEHRLPYRAVAVWLIERYFDAQAHPGQAQEPPATEKEKGCLKRAWNRFGQRVAALATVLGQMMQIRRGDPKPFWSALRRLGNLPAILRQLGKSFNTSLLHDYLCLLPWSTNSG
jgi:hypothetical protein